MARVVDAGGYEANPRDLRVAGVDDDAIEAMQGRRAPLVFTTEEGVLRARTRSAHTAPPLGGPAPASQTAPRSGEAGGCAPTSGACCRGYTTRPPYAYAGRRQSCAPERRAKRGARRPCRFPTWRGGQTGGRGQRAWPAAHRPARARNRPARARSGRAGHTARTSG